MEHTKYLFTIGLMFKKRRIRLALNGQDGLLALLYPFYSLYPDD